MGGVPVVCLEWLHLPDRNSVLGKAPRILLFLVLNKKQGPNSRGCLASLVCLSRSFGARRKQDASENSHLHSRVVHWRARRAVNETCSSIKGITIAFLKLDTLTSLKEETSGGKHASHISCRVASKAYQGNEVVALETGRSNQTGFTLSLRAYKKTTCLVSSETLGNSKTVATI